MSGTGQTREQALLEEIERLRNRLAEPEDTLAAIRFGEVDAFVVTEEVGEKVYVLKDPTPPYRLMVEEMKEGAATLDSSQTILYANRRLAEILERPPETLRGGSFGDFVAPESLGDWKSLLAGSRSGRGEVLLRKDSGQTFPAQVAVTEFHEERISAFCIVITDLTEQKRQTASAAAEEAWRDADRRKDEFLAILGHELRSPLSAISNSIRILDQLGPTESPLAWARDVIRRQVQHLGRIVDDLLDVSRITTGKIEIRRDEVDLCGLVGGLSDGYRSLFEQRRRRLNVSIPAGPLPVDADGTRLEQIVSNLLDNAMKFTEEGGQVWLTLSSREGRAVLTVRDEGIGISPEVLPRIFDLFTQGFRPGSRGGLGIGLALVRKLIELQDGTIEARSEGPGRGAEFEISLPLALRSGRIAAKADVVRPAAARPQRVLIVEDHVDSAEGLATVLRLDGHEVKAVYDGASAISCAAEFRPETILVDIGLPEMDGYEVGRRLREALGDEVLIVALTGYGQEDDRRRSEEAKIDHHVLKPVHIDVISELMTSRRERSSGRREQDLRNAP